MTIHKIYGTIKLDYNGILYLYERKRAMKRVLSLTIAIVMVLGLIPFAGIGAYAAADGVTLSSTELADYSNLNSAINNSENGGTITVKGTYTLPSSFNWTSHGKSVIITGGTFDASAVSTLNIRDSVTFDDMTLKWTGTVYANGNSLKVDSDVTVSGTVTAIYGGGNGTTVASTDLTLLSGNYKTIFGGSNKGTVSGDTNVYVGGTANSECDASSHSATYTVYGGGNGDTIGGNTYLTVADSMKANYIYGGSMTAGAKISGTAYLDAKGGTVMSVYGAGKNVDCVANTVTTITGGTFEQVFGGSEEASVTGDVLLRVWGGTISRRIYGGCYNDYSGSSLFNKKWQSSNCVSGTITLVIGSGANITYSSSDSDKALFAKSRRNNEVKDGNSRLFFSDPSASTVKTGAQDLVMQLIMSGVAVANEKHTLSHTVDNNVITETCSCGCGHSATAALTLDPNASLQFDGTAKTPVFIEYSENFIGEPLGEITYANNTDIGTATATAELSREALTATLSFDIWASVTDTILAIAKGTTNTTLTLNTNASFKDIPVDGDTLVSMVKAVEQGRINPNGYALTDLTVSISTKEQLTSLREYTQGSFILSSDIDMSGEALSSPALTLCNSELFGNRHVIYNYSATDCGLIAVASKIGNEVAISSLYIGKQTSKVSVNASTANNTAAALIDSVPENASLRLERITVYTSADGKGSLGGIIGSAFGNVTLSGCTSYSSIASTDGVAGGLIATADVSATRRITITDSANKGTVMGVSVGGAIGRLTVDGGSATLAMFKNEGKVHGLNNAGGAIGLVNGVGTLDLTSILNAADVLSETGYAGSVTSTVTDNTVVCVDKAVNLGAVGSSNAGSGTIVSYTNGSTVTVKNSVNAGTALGDTDTQIIFGGSPTLENNSSLPLKNKNSNTSTVSELSDAMGILNDDNNGYSDIWGKFMVNTDGTRLVQGTPILYGVQQGNITKVVANDVEKEVFSVRFVIVINDTLNYRKLGLRIKADNGTPVDIDSPYVFTTLLETVNGGEQKEVTPDAIGGSYIYAVTVNNIPVSGMNADGSVMLTATPYAIDYMGNEYFGSAKSVTYVYGEMQSQAK